MDDDIPSGKITVLDQRSYIKIETLQDRWSDPVARIEEVYTANVLVRKFQRKYYLVGGGGGDNIK
jgi:hypothetical protein